MLFINTPHKQNRPFPSVGYQLVVTHRDAVDFKAQEIRNTDRFSEIVSDEPPLLLI